MAGGWGPGTELGPPFQFGWALETPGRANASFTPVFPFLLTADPWAFMWAPAACWGHPGALGVVRVTCARPQPALQRGHHSAAPSPKAAGAWLW